MLLTSIICGFYFPFKLLLLSSIRQASLPNTIQSYLQCIHISTIASTCVTIVLLDFVILVCIYLANLKLVLLNTLFPHLVHISDVHQAGWEDTEHLVVHNVLNRASTNSRASSSNSFCPKLPHGGTISMPLKPQISSHDPTES